MISREIAIQAIEGGLAAICAWCEHYHTQASQHVNEKFRCGKRCGGPGADTPMAFPLYKGPMAGRLTAMCFVCGGDADAAVDVGGDGMVGVCEQHISLLRKMLARFGKKVNVKERKVVEF